jgi:hypothetical protein
LRPEEFHPQQLERGKKYPFDLELGGAASDIALPVLVGVAAILRNETPEPRGAVRLPPIRR